MYELLLKNNGQTKKIAIGNSYDELFQKIKDDLHKKGEKPAYFRMFDKDGNRIVDYGSHQSKYIIKKVVN